MDALEERCILDWIGSSSNNTLDEFDEFKALAVVADLRRTLADLKFVAVEYQSSCVVSGKL